MAAGAYGTWRGFYADFELIIANARHYNKPSHDVHKSAVELAHRVRKLLEDRDGAALEKAAREARRPGGNKNLSAPPGYLAARVCW